MGDPVNLQVLRTRGEGREKGLWIRWILPQPGATGMTTCAAHGGIASLQEARAYQTHQTVLGRFCNSSIKP